MAFGFKNNKEKASIRTVTLTGTRPSTQAGTVDFSFPIESDEIVLALMFKPNDGHEWHYISDYDEVEEPSDEARILRACHAYLFDTFYISCYVTGTQPGENPSVTVKAVLMKVD